MTGVLKRHAERMMVKWVKRWNTWTAPKASLPGVWRRKEGGFLVRGRARDPSTGKRTEVKFVVLDVNDAATAFERLQAALREVQTGSSKETSRIPLFSDFTVSFLEEKINDGSIASEATKKKWASVLERQLIPRFGAKPVDEVGRNEVMAWRADVATEIRRGEYSPHTGNDWLAILRVIMSEAVDRFELERDPMRKVENFDTRLHRTYTREQPNSLKVDQVPAFLAKLGQLFPEYLALVVLGFSTGLRPSSLRPLRRKGPHADILWSEGMLLVRRSHTEDQVAIEMTKTARDQEIVLPQDLIDVLQWQADRLPVGPKRDSDLLFPADDGGFLHRGCLRTPFEQVCAALDLPQRVTPRGMRRTFQDLARHANMHDFVTRAVSGHATEAMQSRYSTVSPAEVQQGLAKVVELAKARDALASAESSFQLGVHRGVHPPNDKKAG